MQFKSEFVSDDEILYRRVPIGRNLYTYPEGKLRISSQAFADRQAEISVDRSILCNNDPSYTKVDVTDGVTSLITAEVRESKISINSNPPVEYLLDVKSAPIENNKAHALIISAPEYKSNRGFEKVREKLAILATQHGWQIPPVDII